MALEVYGIGNPLIDITVHVDEDELSRLGLNKGTMHLIDARRHDELLGFIEAKHKIYGCGGSAPNTLVTLALFGVKVALAGKLGGDAHASIYRERLSELSVTDGLKEGGERTGTSIILVSPDSERTMNTYLGANREFGTDDLDEQRVAEAKYLYFTGYMWDTPRQQEAVKRALTIARRSGTTIVFDLADPFAVSRNREAFLELIREHAQIVFANGEEARILFENYAPGECAKSLGELTSTAVVKNGSRGSYVCERGRLQHIPVTPRKALDSTGAGDTYAAGFLLGLTEGLSAREAAEAASLLAGEVIMQHGAQLYRERIENLDSPLVRSLL